MDIVPSLKRAAVLLDPGDKRTVGITAFQALAAKQGIKTRAFPLLHADTFEAVLNGVARYQPAILFIERSPMTLMLRDSICQFATAHAIPVIGEGIVMAKAGALISYGADELETTRRLPVYVDKILKGANRGDGAFLDTKSGLHKWTNCSMVTAAMPIQRSRSHETVTQEPLIEV